MDSLVGTQNRSEFSLFAFAFEVVSIVRLGTLDFLQQSDINND